jgi:hypothetical protein
MQKQLISVLGPSHCVSHIRPPFLQRTQLLKETSICSRCLLSQQLVKEIPDASLLSDLDIK